MLLYVFDFNLFQLAARSHFGKRLFCGLGLLVRSKLKMKEKCKKTYLTRGLRCERKNDKI